jgi:hypothetical protein
MQFLTLFFFFFFCFFLKNQTSVRGSSQVQGHIFTHWGIENLSQKFGNGKAASKAIASISYSATRSSDGVHSSFREGP